MRWCLCGHLLAERNNRPQLRMSDNAGKTKEDTALLSLSVCASASQSEERNLRRFVIDNSDIDYPLFSVSVLYCVFVCVCVLDLFHHCQPRFSLKSLAGDSVPKALQQIFVFSLTCFCMHL